MHLLQLAGGQAWPNLLAILALRPSRVTYLTSSDPNQDYRRGIEAIHDACRSLDVKTDHRIISTQKREPTTDECRKSLEALNPDCINLTGGTKPMSLAAYDVATLKGIPSFYIDTRRRDSPAESVNRHAASIRDQINGAFPEIVASLTVPIALRANGFPVPQHFKAPPEPWVRFANRAAQLRQSPEADLEIAQAIGKLRVQLMGTGSDIPKKRHLRSVLQLPITATTDSHWHQYLLAASEEGIVQLTDTASPLHQEFFLLNQDPVHTAADTLRSLASETFKLLEGVWFELAVLHHLRQKASFSDIAWSVEADHRQDPAASSRGETDLVAFNTVGLGLHFISCKTSGPHSSPLDHIQGLRNRATKEGGQFSKAELWVFRPKTENHRGDLDKHCREHKVDLRIFVEQQATP
jgi:hypothetical protein